MPTLQPRAPSQVELRAFAILSIVYATLTIGLIPWAQEPALASARVALVSASGILVAELCTAVLLALEYRASGRSSFLLLACGYFYGALMAAAHLALFPGALFARPLFGNEQTVGWLFLAWRLGFAAIVLAAVIRAAHDSPAKAATRRDPSLAKALGLTIVGTALVVVLGAQVHIAGIVINRFTAASQSVQWLCVVVYSLALVQIWVRRAFHEVLYLWLGLALVAAIADLVLGNVGGGRYTLGWHASRASSVVSACLLLAFLLSEKARSPARAAGTLAAAYGGAAAATLAAMFLRWFLEPWLGAEAPFILFLGAVAVAVWLGGAGPAMLSAALGYALINFLYVEPRGAFGIAHAKDFIHLALFILASTLVIGLGQGMRRARDRARASEVEARKRAEQLERADVNKSQFLAILSHELRNPLAPLRTGVEILKLEPDRAASTRTLGIMERQIVHLNRLIDDLLDVSRIDRGKLELRTERVALDVVVRSALETAMPGIEAKSHELVVRYPGQPLYVEGDAVRLSQVLANLLNNAAKFTPAAGRIEVALRAHDGHALITVADSGIGIAAEQLEVVFEMFAQLKPGSAAGGLGLGLTLARSIARRHGGELHAESRGAGAGAQFILSLPLASAPAPQPAAAAAAPPAGPRRAVLVVDDNADGAYALGELLRMQGHRVEVVTDGETALRAARASLPEVAFIDLNMPDVDGFEVARRLRAVPGGDGIRLVALTGMGQETDIARTRESGFEIHLTKPADPRAVARILIEGGGSVVVLHTERHKAGT